MLIHHHAHHLNARTPSLKKTLKITGKALFETVTTIATVNFLLIAAYNTFSHLPKSSFEKIRTRIIQTPPREEFWFRGILMHSFYLPQKILQYYGYLQKGTSSHKKYRLIQIHASAIIFAGAHIWNSKEGALSKLTQFIWSYLGGVVYGRLAIKTQSLAPSILAHGIHNFIACSSYLSNNPILNWTLRLIHGIACYYLGNDSDEAQAGSEISLSPRLC